MDFIIQVAEAATEHDPNEMALDCPEVVLEGRRERSAVVSGGGVVKKISIHANAGSPQSWQKLNQEQENLLNEGLLRWNAYFSVQSEKYAK
jgi:hypothetical protein